jgi:catechol 2,3-dioxygenase-like lactoylglutathione lyase family enzyme
MLSERRVHTTLPTADIDRLRAWYEDVLGFTPFAVRPGAVLYQTAAGSVFAISRGSVLSSGTHTQMAFTVDDIETEAADLRARGVVFEEYEAPKTQDGIATIGAGRAAWFKDPDGNVLALLQFHDPT